MEDSWIVSIQLVSGWRVRVVLGGVRLAYNVLAVDCGTNILNEDECRGKCLVVLRESPLKPKYAT